MHKGADDKAYRCVYKEQDVDGKLAFLCLKTSWPSPMTRLRPTSPPSGVLAASEQLLFLFRLIGCKLINPKWRPYIPDFKKAFEHFCIHIGGLRRHRQAPEEPAALRGAHRGLSHDPAPIRQHIQQLLLGAHISLYIPSQAKPPTGHAHLFSVISSAALRFSLGKQKVRERTTAKFQLLAALCLLSAIVGLPLASPKPHFASEGRVYCDTCRAGFETSATEYIKGNNNNILSHDPIQISNPILR
ncbi:hypothetical protein J5N97_015537 [Dioscorea zingiberensis]|uniref:Uncharacterized protein n=1 Tax=Dioscorea zingiberensis TaxID=325984 RepID=A0A9D5CX91_9LILI|nr:hypothetical protein J5N97_015537 [Dioscorea zingiberensis]